MADKVQSYANHAQIVPMYHYVTLGLLQLTFIGACVNLYQSWGDHARFYSASLLVTLDVCHDSSWPSTHASSRSRRRTAPSAPRSNCATTS